MTTEEEELYNFVLQHIMFPVEFIISYNLLKFGLYWI